MEQNKVYIVVAAGGSYDDAWHSNLSAHLDRTVAELEVLRLQEQSKRIQTILEDVRKFYHEQLKAQAFTLEEVPQPPKGPSKQTKENRAQHKAAMDAYYKLAQPIAQRNEEKRLAAMNAAREAAKQKAIELGAIEDDLKLMGFEEAYFSVYCRDADASYEIEELELR